MGGRSGTLRGRVARRGWRPATVVAKVDLTRLAQGAGIDLDAMALHDDIDSAIDAVSIKPFPIAKQSLAATQAALMLSEAAPHDEITRVSVHVPLG